MASGTGVLQVGPGDHVVLFYDRDAELADRVSAYLLEAIRDDGVAIAVATPAHRRSIEERLAQAGLDVAAASARGSFLALDADETMRRFVTADRPDPASFWQVVSPLVRQPPGRRRPVRVFGEMVAVLWGAGLVNAAIEVEAMWNELGSQYPFSLFCAYPAESVGGEQHLDALAEVCRVHVAALGVPPEPGHAAAGDPGQ